MKIICTKQNLSYGVQVVQKAVSSKNPLPILSGILLQTEGDKLKLSATDLDLGIQCIIPVQTVEEGAIVLPARYLGEIVRRLPDVPIQIEIEEGSYSAMIKYGQSELNINGFPADEFPVLPTISDEINFAISEEIFKEMVRQVIFAIYTNENRPVYTGVLMELSATNLTLVATDTHRLALRKLSLPESKGDRAIIIPGKTLNELSRIIGAPDRQVQVSVTENQILFTMEDTILISRLIDGQFPNYLQVIPQGYKSRLRFRGKDLLEATERASLLAKAGAQVVKLSIEDNLLIITANTEVGRIYEEVPVYLEGESMQVAFNAAYLIEILKAVNSEEIYFELSGPLAPGIIRPVDKDDYLALILPVRTN